MPDLGDLDAHQLFDFIKSSAAQHAEDSGEPDMEIGDLQDALQQALKWLDKDSIRALQKDPDFVSVFNLT